MFKFVIFIIYINTASASAGVEESDEDDSNEDDDSDSNMKGSKQGKQVSASKVNRRTQKPDKKRDKGNHKNKGFFSGL